MKHSVLAMGLLLAGLSSGAMATEFSTLDGAPSSVPAQSLTQPSMVMALPASQQYQIVYKVDGKMMGEGQIRAEMNKDAQFNLTQQAGYVASVSVTHQTVLSSNIQKDEKISSNSTWNTYANKILDTEHQPKASDTTKTSFDPGVVTTGLIVTLTPQDHNLVRVGVNYSELLALRTFVAPDGSSIELPDVFHDESSKLIHIDPQQSQRFVLEVGHCTGSGGGLMYHDNGEATEGGLAASYTCHEIPGAQNPFMFHSANKVVSIEIRRVDEAPNSESTALMGWDHLKSVGTPTNSFSLTSAD